MSTVIYPEAKYGVYDSYNGEWAGEFFYSEADAQKHADELRDDPHLGVVSTTDEADWL